MTLPAHPDSSLSILQPPRQFRLQIDFKFGPDARSDAELTAFILANLAASFAIGGYTRAAGVARIPYIEES